MSVALHISGTISHMTVIYSTHGKNDNISRIFFHFIKILIFWVLWRQKCKRWSKMTKKLSLSCVVSQETYIIWFKFMVYVCKMIISPGGFFIFSKFWFFGLLGDKREKFVQNDKKFHLLHSISQEPYIWLWFLAHMCKMIISPANLFIFQNFDFGGF